MKTKNRRIKYILLTLLLCVFSVAVLAKDKTYTPDPEIVAQILENPAIIHENLLVSMNKLLENPATLTIKITEYDDEQTSLGRFSKVIVKTSNGSAEGLMLHTANIEFHDVQLDISKLIKDGDIYPVTMDNIFMDVVITQQDLNDFLTLKTESIKVKNPFVSLMPGQIELSGSTKYGVLKADFWANGHFSIVNGKEINFIAKQMKVNRMAMPRSFVGQIVRKINPVLNLNKFPFTVNLSEIKIEKCKMIFSSAREIE